MTSAAIIVVAVASSAWSAQGHLDPAGKTETISGEVLDMACYMGHEGKGKKHAKCAAACVAGGAPLGVLTKEGKIYLVVGDHANEKPYVEAKALVGGDAKLTGTVFTRGGLTAIVVSKAEKL
ncbi:MAG: hypothetical protein A2X40_01440 [Elusimicrobia bacterium GWC2_65_9]|nr:MAG: hypothetical protein A2X40_01440 [Elusimicrobia bacterium GWC2_65_9]